jgi:hypothetical protein
MDTQMENLSIGKHNRINRLTKFNQSKKLYAPTEKTNTKKYVFSINGLFICKITSTKTIQDNKKEAK